MMGVLVAWYGVVQVVGLAALPLALRLFGALPDRGYAFAKITGIVLTGVVFWLGYSYGLLRHEAGAAWIALAVVAAVGLVVGWKSLQAYWDELREAGNWRVVLAVETLFLIGFVLWAMVRAYDPAVDHTEEPMDLMFMNSIWAGATYPPQDAWLAGYPISYYYLGYWLLTMLGRLAGQPPQIAYSVGQATWYGLLLIGCFGVVTNLLAFGYDRRSTLMAQGMTARPATWISPASMAGGALAAVAVGVIGNLMVALEWMYAQGMNVSAVANLVKVNGFPERATQSGNWYIGMEWWWWRSSRVISDVDLLGGHIEVIDEFPMFSYVLGDNHPHVLAMPVVLAVIGLALNLLIWLGCRLGEGQGREQGWNPARLMPLGYLGLGVYVLMTGALIFLNTWDFPPYWLLMVGACAVGCWLKRESLGPWWRPVVGLGMVLIAGTLLLYLPYFLTAQSQAGGIVPNLFNPTRLPQFLLMFGQFVPAVAGLLVMAWPRERMDVRTLGLVALLVLGAPILFLGVSGFLAFSTEAGAQRLAGVALPPDVTEHAPFMLQRWGRQFWTALALGIGLTLALTLLVQTVGRIDAKNEVASDAVQSARLARVFALMMAAVGLAMVYAPEFVYLADQFGSRMNTVFKFYYQGWLLLGLASAYAVAAAWRASEGPQLGARVLGLISALLMAAGLLFPAAAVYAKTGGFRTESPTFDVTAYIGPDEQAAVVWVRSETLPQSRILEGRGASYWASHNRISTMTGRPTLLGWEGHERQWRGRAYPEMAAGRAEALALVYRDGTAEQIRAVLDHWGVDYVYVGPSEIEQYGITPERLRILGEVMELAFEQGQVWIFRGR